MATYLPNQNVAISSPIETSKDVRIAAFTCEGLEQLSRELGFRVAVVAAVKNVDDHIGRLRDLWYASGIPRTWDEWFIPFDFNNWSYRTWSLVLMDVRWFGPTPHPVGTCVDDGTFLLHLPCGVGPTSYATAFQNGLTHLRFEAVARRPSALVKRHHARKPVVVTSRYSRASVSDDTAVEVRDLIAFDARALPRVADVAFRALVDVVATVQAA